MVSLLSLWPGLGRSEVESNLNSGIQYVSLVGVCDPDPSTSCEKLAS